MLVAQFHPIKNAPLRPRDISYGSIRMVWWRCGAGHEWKDTPNHRTGGRGCPYCSGRRPSTTHSLAAMRPDLVREWDRRKNAPLRPSLVTIGSDRMVWWKCRCGKDHEWRASVGSRSRGTGCPFCAGKRLSETNALAKRHPRIAREWHPTRNRPLRPEAVVSGTERRVWWRCARKGHVWQASVASRTREGRGCPMCSGLVVTRETSLARRKSDAARFWHPSKNGALTPWDVAPGSHRKVWWLCPEGPDHEWRTTVSTQTNNGGRCPFCMHRKLSITNCLATPFPVVARQWHPTRNGKLSPRDILGAVARRVWWKCDVGHAWEAIVSNRTRLGSGCPLCRPGRATRKHRPLLTERGGAEARRYPATTRHRRRNCSRAPRNA
jgi:hypothetical protein